MADRLQLVEAGVSNFKNFQTEMRGHKTEVHDFIVRHDERENAVIQTDKRRSRIHFALLGALLAIVTGCAIAVFTWILNGHHAVSFSSTAATTRQDASTPTDYGQ